MPLVRNKSRMKQYRFLGGFIALFIFLLFLVMVVAPRLFLSHPGLRNTLNRMTEETTGFRGEWMPFQIRGWTLSSNGFEGVLPDAQIPTTVRLESVEFHLDWKGLLTRQWTVSRISVKGVRLSLGGAPGELPLPPDTVEAPAWAAVVLPRNAEVQRIQFSHAEILWNLPSGEQLRLHEMESEWMVQTDGRWSGRVSQGQLILPERSPWKLSFARLNASPQGDLDLLESEWLAEKSGIARVQGSLLNQSKLKTGLDVRIHHAAISQFLPSPWRPFVQGQVEVRARIAARAETFQIKGSITGEQTKIIGLPFQQDLQQATGMTAWTQLQLPTARSDFEYSREVLRLSELECVNPELMSVTGALRIGPNRMLDGTLEVGLVEKAVRTIPGARSQVFTREDSGYFWASPPMRVAGTLDRPREDLSPRLKSAFMDAAGEEIKTKLDQGMQWLEGILRQVPARPSD